MPIKNQDLFYEIARSIHADFEKLIRNPLYIAIIDSAGVIHHIESQLQQFNDFIKNFVINNFNLLNIGDHSLPLGGINLAFFKITDKAMVILYTAKGRIGQLLSFKVKMHNWSKQIDELIGEVTPLPPAIQIPEGSAEIDHEPKIISEKPINNKKWHGLKKIPILIKKLKGNEKFPIEIAQILQYCDGKHDIDEICELTQYSRLKVDNIIRILQKKKWIEFEKMLF
ncbi:MAG: hypothetical protein ACFFD2_02305 [Promethearchaeota archaeon]